MTVVILGKPGSGNCIIRDLLEAAGVDYPYVSHGWRGDPAPIADRYILTQRTEAIRARSRRLRKGLGFEDEEARNDHALDFYSYARAIVSNPYHDGAKMMLVHYRDIVERPEETRRMLLEFVGADIETPWPRPITDEDEKHLRAMECGNGRRGS